MKATKICDQIKRVINPTADRKNSFLYTSNGARSLNELDKNSERL